MVHFSKSLDRKFSLRYNPYTQSVEIMDTTEKIIKVMKDIQSQLSTLTTALGTLKVKKI